VAEEILGERRLHRTSGGGLDAQLPYRTRCSVVRPHDVFESHGHVAAQAPRLRILGERHQRSRALDGKPPAGRHHATELSLKTPSKLTRTARGSSAAIQRPERAKPPLPARIRRLSGFHLGGIREHLPLPTRYITLSAIGVNKPHMPMFCRFVKSEARDGRSGALPSWRIVGASSGANKNSLGEFARNHTLSHPAATYRARAMRGPAAT
jgi:hypothetical protein